VIANTSNFLRTESQLEIRTAEFLKAFSATENTLSLVFKQQLDGIFGKYKPNVIRSAHAHYVVNIELICVLFAPCSCVLCLTLSCVCLFCYSIIATSFLVSKGEYICCTG